MKSIAILLLASAAASLAQLPAERAVTQSQSPAGKFRTMPGGSFLRDVSTESAPELYPGEIEDVGPQFLLARRAAAAGPSRHQWFEAFADWQLFYTNNALLTEKNVRDTGIMVTTVQMAVNFPSVKVLGGELASKLGYRQQWWMYSPDKSRGDLNNFDFTVGTVFLASRHSWDDDKWVASLEIDYNRYLSRDDDWAEFYVELAPYWSLERNFHPDEKTLITVGYYGGYHWTETDPQPVTNINDRLDNSLGLTITREILPRLVGQFYYRLQWSHYSTNSNRNDVYNSLGLAVIYNFNNWASIRAFVGYENRNSTDELIADYNKLDTGGGLTFTARF